MLLFVTKCKIYTCSSMCHSANLRSHWILNSVNLCYQNSRIRILSKASRLLYLPPESNSLWVQEFMCLRRSHLILFLLVWKYIVKCSKSWSKATQMFNSLVQLVNLFLIHIDVLVSKQHNLFQYNMNTLHMISWKSK